MNIVNAHRMRILFILLFCAVLGTANAALGAVINASPTSLDFGTVKQGQSKSLTVTVENAGSTTLSLKFSTDPPFAVRPVSLDIDSHQTVHVNVALSPIGTTPTTDITGQLKIQAFNQLILIETTSIALQAKVVPPIVDLTISKIELVSQTATNVGRKVLIRLTLNSNGADIRTMTRAFARIGTSAEDQILADGSSLYTAAGNPVNMQVVLTVPNQPITLTVRAKADADGAVAEGAAGERNNETTVDLALPPVQ